MFFMWFSLLHILWVPVRGRLNVGQGDETKALTPNLAVTNEESSKAGRTDDKSDCYRRPPTICCFQVVVVLSGSMEPGMFRGDILFLNMGKAPIRTGEIVVFNIDGRDIPIVHRVMRVSHLKHGVLSVAITICNT